MRITCASIVLLGSIAAAPAAAATPVVVGGYPFPPFVDAQAPHGGLTRSMIAHLNAIQDTYTFKFEKTSPQRRYAGFRKDRFDVMFFEMPSWGWHEKKIDIATIGPVMTGGEVYVARASDVESHRYFDNIGEKKIAAIRGYHYGFANYRDGKSYLKKNYDITLTSSHQTNLKLVERGRVDIAVVTKSYLKWYFKKNPEKKDVFTVANAMDQMYSLHVVVDGDASAIDADKMKALLRKLEKTGKLQPALKTFGVADQWAL